MKQLALALTLLATTAPGTAGAQDWGVSWMPVLVPSSNEFPFLALGLDYSKMAPYEAPYASDGAFVAGAGATFEGSWFVSARFQAPGLIPKWRFDIRTRAIQQNRFGYYGIGNGTTYDGAVAATFPDYYRVRWNQYSGQVEVSRQLAGPLRVSVAGRWQRTEFRPIADSSQFALDAMGQTVVNNDASARLSVMVDTRDTEYNTQRGILLEAGAKAGSGGDGYTWAYGSFSGFVSPRDGTVLGVRVAGAAAGGTPPLSERFEFNSWERDRLSYGGRFTNRGFPDPRFGGESVVLGNVDLRHDLLNLGDLGAITLMLFGDVGRVYENEAFSLDDLHWGAGGGFALRVLRSNIWTFNFSDGSEGFRFLFGSGWMF